MAVTEARDRTRQCTDKFPYRSKAEAKRDVKSRLSRGKTKAVGGTKVLTVYRCPWSDDESPHWHAGHRPDPSARVRDDLRPGDAARIAETSTSRFRGRVGEVLELLPGRVQVRFGIRDYLFDDADVSPLEEG